MAREVDNVRESTAWKSFRRKESDGPSILHLSGVDTCIVEMANGTHLLRNSGTERRYSV